MPKVRWFDWSLIVVGVICGFVAIRWSVPTLGFVGGGVFTMGIHWLYKDRDNHK